VASVAFSAKDRDLPRLTDHVVCPTGTAHVHAARRGAHCLVAISRTRVDPVRGVLAGVLHLQVPELDLRAQLALEAVLAYPTHGDGGLTG
jgi:hypothetical protein